ncbi:hypothetical protein Mgra_00007595 [Meloidogyne graminicola]|nr:hypothetical protein Mgra_00007595 [Meloidogyne graminicola]KAF7633014.1 hypothetical protein Mgra_00007595 [Meloidogyne graminicola]
MKGVSVGKGKRRPKPKTKLAKFKRQNKKQSNQQTILEKKPNPFDLECNKRFGGNSKVQKGKAAKLSTGLLGKSKIFDRRIGQRNSQLTEDNRTEKRFIFQQKSWLKKKAVELEVKNDGSQDKPEIENFGLKRVHWRNMGNSEDSNDEESEDENYGKQSKRSRKESLAQIVANDRQMKALKSMLKDEQEEIRERLDASFKEIKQFGGLIQGRSLNEKSEESFDDAYDSLYNELQFNPTPIVRPQSITTFNKNESSTQQK